MRELLIWRHTHCDHASQRSTHRNATPQGQPRPGCPGLAVHQLSMLISQMNLHVRNKTEMVHHRACNRELAPLLAPVLKHLPLPPLTPVNLKIWERECLPCHPNKHHHQITNLMIRDSVTTNSHNVYRLQKQIVRFGTK